MRMIPISELDDAARTIRAWHQAARRMNDLAIKGDAKGIQDLYFDTAMSLPFYGADPDPLPSKRGRAPPLWMIGAAIALKESPPPFRLQFQVGARWRATKHVLEHWRALDLHRIWRQYRYLGLQTLHIGCSCGARFDREKPKSRVDAIREAALSSARGVEQPGSSFDS